MALVLPVLLLLVVGLFDFGRAVYAHNTVSNAARIASRVAIVDQNPARVRQAAIDESPGLGLTPTDVTVAYSCDPVKIGCRATTSVTYGYVAATPLVHAVVGNIVITATSEMPVERVFVSP